MRHGTVKQFDQGSSFGFVRDEQNQKSYFVYYTAILNAKRLSPGQKVAFELAPGKKGLQCINVRLLSKED